MVTESIADVPMTNFILPFIIMALMLIFFIAGIVLLIKSRNIDSKHIKTGIFVSLVNNFFILALIISGLIIFKTTLFFYIGIFIGAVPMFILSVVAFSISSYGWFKTHSRHLALASCGYALIFLSYSGFYLFRVGII